VKGIRDVIISEKVYGYTMSTWLHNHHTIARLLDAPLCGTNSNYFKVLEVYACEMCRSRINFILKKCFNTPVSYHLKFSGGVNGYFKIGANTYEASFVEVYFDENYNFVRVNVDESRRVIYAMNDGKVKYLVKLAKTLIEKLEKLEKMLELVPPEKRDYVNLFFLLASHFLETTCLNKYKLCANYDYELVKHEIKRLSDETDMILNDVKKYYAEKTLFPE
jgi:hypothetical protein